IRTRRVEDGDAVIPPGQIDRRIRRPVVEKDDVGDPEGEVMLEERLDMQGPVPHDAQHDQLVSSIRDLLGTVNVSQTETEDQWSNAEFDDLAAGGADAPEIFKEAPELVGVVNALAPAATPRGGRAGVVPRPPEAPQR